MKKLGILMIVLLSALFINEASAQKVGKKEMEKIDAQVKEMTEVMSLSADQSAKVKELKIELSQKNKEVASKHQKGSEELKAARKANMQAYNTQLKEVCTKKQMQLWQKHKKEQKN